MLFREHTRPPARPPANACPCLRAGGAALLPPLATPRGSYAEVLATPRGSTLPSLFACSGGGRQEAAGPGAAPAPAPAAAAAHAPAEAPPSPVQRQQAARLAAEEGRIRSQLGHLGAGLAAARCGLQGRLEAVLALGAERDALAADVASLRGLCAQAELLADRSRAESESLGEETKPCPKGRGAGFI